MISSKEALLYASLKQFKYLVEKTDNFIKESLAKVENPYLACSFGKDSAVMLHLVLKHKPDIPVRFISWDNESEYLGNYTEVISKWSNINLTTINLSRTTIEDKVKGRYDVSGYDSYFIGFRAEESKGRRITIRSCGAFYEMKNGLKRICPVSEWKTIDIAAYIVLNNIPTLDTYTEFGFEERTSSRIPRADYGIREYSLKLLKKKDITSYNKLLLIFPEIENYI